MRRLKNPKIKEVSLAISPANCKSFLFLKEEEVKMNEEIQKINTQLNELLGKKDEPAIKEEDLIKTIEDKITALGNVIKKDETLEEVVKAQGKSIEDIIAILNEVITYLKNLKSYGYGYPAPKTEVKPVEEVKKEEPKVEPKVEIVKEPEIPKEPLYTKVEVEAIVQSVVDEINKEEK
jgi:hypothetical protein